MKDYGPARQFRSDNKILESNIEGLTTRVQNNRKGVRIWEFDHTERRLTGRRVSTWSDAISGAANESLDPNGDVWTGAFYYTSDSNFYHRVSYLGFDTSSLGSGAMIIDACFVLYGSSPTVRVGTLPSGYVQELVLLAYDWGGGPSPTHLTRSALLSLPAVADCKLFGEFASERQGGGTSVTKSGHTFVKRTALLSSINKVGVSRFVLTSKHVLDNVAPPTSGTLTIANPWRAKLVVLGVPA